jgi:hypothetical protein
MVLLLSLSAVSPELHAMLHERGVAHPKHACTHAHAHADAVPEKGAQEEETHTCAVTLFARGIVQHAVALLPLPCEAILRAENVRALERMAFAPPRYLHLPPQAPPAV